MRSIDMFRRFLLIILPFYDQVKMSGILAAAAVIPALIPVLRYSSLQQAASLIFTLKILYPHHFREYHSPFYAEPRSEDLWQNYMLMSWPDHRFRETFRVNKACFYELCQRCHAMEGILHVWLYGNC